MQSRQRRGLVALLRLVATGTVLCLSLAGVLSSAAASTVPTLPRPHLVVTSARAVCFGYSAKAKGYDSRDGGYRKLLVNFAGTGLVAGDSYTLVPLMQLGSRWTEIGAGISFGFRARARAYDSHDAQVTSVYATDALIIPHQPFAAQFTLTNLGKSNDATLMNSGKLKPGISNKVTVTIPGSPVSTCPHKLP